jgi:small GTP-binding protein
VKIIDNKKFQVKIWDTAGQEKFAVIAKSYYQRAHGIILTCSITNRSSFNNIKNWLNSIKENTNEDSIQLIIIANKIDLENEREVKTEEISKKAKELNIEYYETSAKENINIDESFNKIIEKVHRNLYNKQQGFALGNKKDNDKGKEGSKCCNN